MQKHLVHRQKVTLQIPGKDDAFALQSMVSYLLQNELKTKLESALDSVFPPGKVVRIDTLQLDLGEINPQNFEHEFKTRFVSALTESLSAKKESINNSSGDESIQSVAQSSVNALVFFLEKGYLPWYSSVQKMANWEADLLQNLTKNEYRFLAEWLKNNPNATSIDRLVLQFSDRLITEVLLNIASSASDNWEPMFADYVFILNIFNADKTVLSSRKEQKSHKQKAQTDSEDRYFDSNGVVLRNKIWQFAFEVLLNKQHSEYSFKILKLLTDHFRITSKPIGAAKEKKILTGIKTYAVKNAFKQLVLFFKSNGNTINIKTKVNGEDEETIAKDIKQTIEGSQGTSDTSRKKKGKNKSGIINTDGDSIDRNDSQSNQDKNYNKQETILDNETKPQSKEELLKKRNKNSDLNEKDIISINNCGTVILNPFIKIYFERLALMENNKFINEEARARAVMLLYYLATGMTEAAEFDLALQKILCEHPLEQPLVTNIKLSTKEKRQSNDLLKNVLSYWEPLKTSSIGGFREAFLQRNGNLELKENGWLLKVEQKTIDILLGKLPWGFSTIRHPWMESILSVDWY
ncbi:hypothetical protein JN11_01434 [Mucilaginibacter frigoritolerans]|uniref:Uncharacterized protein n=1 Tax=Mucilaginibacter frigoritolerans TaxID=652788 RepID=A0A562UB75_9SPHI|nr:contractile injection system tape measure protein [Mucilaginibacter frigoritolerans]TWJ02461.1 hypothetical protein JN11_01434 [Mucilaginibacter frigoritolerans]